MKSGGAKIRGGAVAALAAATVALLTPAIGTAAPPINDSFGGRLPLLLGNTDTRSNGEATVEAGERLTPNDPGGFGCNTGGAEEVGAIQMDRTLWWSFTGNGGPVTVSTLSSSFDTALAVYEVPGGALVGCNDDLQPVDPTRPNLHYRLASELLVHTVAEREYAVQVGGCTPPEACGADAGTVNLRVSSTPPNDDRAHATAIASTGRVLASNTGATSEPGEGLMCGASPYGKTIWFRYTAPAIGTAVFSTSGFDTVMAVYREGSTSPIDCNDDAVKGESGGSRVPASEPPEASLEVTPGDYLIQVGGYHDPGFGEVAAANGQLEAQVEFNEDMDLDNDGVDRGHDCDDHNADIRPGLPEIANNDVDENCDGIKAFDRDRDGYLAPPAGDDCDDSNGHIHPDAPERRGNRVDENCDGVKARRLRLTSEATLRVKRLSGDPRTMVKTILVRRVPAGARVEVRCMGRGCPFSVKRHAVRQFRATLAIPAGFWLEPGSRLEVRVTKRDWIGRATRFAIRSDKPLVQRSYCLDQHGRRSSC